MSLVEIVEKLGEDDRRALVLARHYENCRRDTGQRGYVCFRFEDERLLDSPAFKAFRTVSLWLKETGFVVGWKDYHWQGFVAYVFEHLHPHVPHPGQLRNPVALKEYILSCPKTEDPISVEALEQLGEKYRKALRPEFEDENLYYTVVGKCLESLKQTVRDSSKSEQENSSSNTESRRLGSQKK